MPNWKYIHDNLFTDICMKIEKDRVKCGKNDEHKIFAKSKVFFKIFPWSGALSKIQGGHYPENQLNQGKVRESGKGLK